MGVDASYLYGYGANINEIEWDVEYLREKYKDKLNEKVDSRYDWKPTWDGFISSLSEIVENDDIDFLVDCLEDIDNLITLNYTYDDIYLTFDHKQIAELYPDTKLKDLDDVAKLYAKELGIKNVEVIKWIEFGYFS